MGESAPPTPLKLKPPCSSPCFPRTMMKALLPVTGGNHSPCAVSALGSGRSLREPLPLPPWMDQDLCSELCARTQIFVDERAANDRSGEAAAVAMPLVLADCTRPVRTRGRVQCYAIRLMGLGRCEDSAPALALDAVAGLRVSGHISEVGVARLAELHGAASGRASATQLKQAGKQQYQQRCLQPGGWWPPAVRAARAPRGAGKSKSKVSK